MMLMLSCLLLHHMPCCLWKGTVNWTCYILWSRQLELAHLSCQLRNSPMWKMTGTDAMILNGAWVDSHLILIRSKWNVSIYINYFLFFNEKLGSIVYSNMNLLEFVAEAECMDCVLLSIQQEFGTVRTKQSSLEIQSSSKLKANSCSIRSR
mgnify:CR=1 FL=1